MSYKLEGAYQSSSEEVDPRASFLISKNWNDKFGILLNVAASKRSFRTDGWSSQGWTSGRVGAQVRQTLMGGATITQVTQNTRYRLWRGLRLEPAEPAAQQRDDARQRASSTSRGSRTPSSPMRSVPRLGRPELQIGTRDRIGASFAMQWQPNDKVDLTFDALFADLEAEFDRYTNNLLVRNTNAGTNNATGFRIHHAAQLRARRESQRGERYARRTRSSGPRTASNANETEVHRASRSAATGRCTEKIKLRRQGQSRGIRLGLPHDHLPAACRIRAT